MHRAFFIVAMNYYVYVHRKLTTGEIFYVGKGCGKRAWKKSTRSDYWKRIEAKYGRSVQIIMDGLSEDEAFAEEQWVIADIGRENLCNLIDGGIGGKSPSIETRMKMSAARMGRVVSDETKERNRIASTGRTHSDETKEKIRLHFLGKKNGPRSAETRLKISERKKGIKKTEEHKRKISESKKGKPGRKLSDAEKENLRKINTGRMCPEDVRRRISEANKGKKFTPEQYARMLEKVTEANKARSVKIRCSNGMEFDSVQSAADWVSDQLGKQVAGSNISSCCSGKLKKAYGYTWSRM